MPTKIDAKIANDIMLDAIADPNVRGGFVADIYSTDRVDMLGMAMQMFGIPVNQVDLDALKAHGETLRKQIPQVMLDEVENRRKKF